jgi:hypothetical protein
VQQHVLDRLRLSTNEKHNSTITQVTYSLSSSRHTMLSPLRGLLRVCACAVPKNSREALFASSDDDSLEPLLELAIAHLDIAWSAS